MSHSIRRCTYSNKVSSFRTYLTKPTLLDVYTEESINQSKSMDCPTMHKESLTQRGVLYEITMQI